VEASCYAPLGDALYATQHKHWGELVGVEPLAEDAPLHDERVGYDYHENSRYNRRFLQRKHLKKALGKQHRQLVKRAMRLTLRDFQRDHAGAAAVVRRRLGLDLARFWRAARGREFVELPTDWVQGAFDFGD
jgi:hypothetical protein